MASSCIITSLHDVPKRSHVMYDVTWLGTSIKIFGFLSFQCIWVHNQRLTYNRQSKCSSSNNTYLGSSSSTTERISYVIMKQRQHSRKTQNGEVEGKCLKFIGKKLQIKLRSSGGQNCKIFLAVIDGSIYQMRQKLGIPDLVLPMSFCQLQTHCSRVSSVSAATTTTKTQPSVTAQESFTVWRSHIRKGNGNKSNFNPKI